MSVTRRQLLTGGAAGVGLAVAGSLPAFAEGSGPSGRGGRGPASGRPFPPLEDDPAGILALPAGFRYRVTRTGQTSLDGGIGRTPGDHDGTVAFAAGHDRLRLVQNHELEAFDNEFGVPHVAGTVYDPGAENAGGCTVIETDRDGRNRGERVGISGTVTNCAGGPTPWGTWLTCEETETRAGTAWSANGHSGTYQKDHGYVFEVFPDPSVRPVPVPIKAFGRFAHEALAVSPDRTRVYLSEDASGPNGLFYRWTAPSGVRLGPGFANRLGPTAGRLEAMTIVLDDGSVLPDVAYVTSAQLGRPFRVRWVEVPERNATTTSVRKQFADGEVTRGKKFEGVFGTKSGAYVVNSFAFSDGDLPADAVKHDGLVWFYDYAEQTITLVTYFPHQDSAETGATPRYSDMTFDGPDNVTVTPLGTLVLAEDGLGASHVLSSVPGGPTYAIARNQINIGTAAEPEFSEFTGPTFSPRRSGAVREHPGPGRHAGDHRPVGEVPGALTAAPAAGGGADRARHHRPMSADGIAIALLPAADSHDAHVAGELARLVNDVYRAAEEGIWRDGTSRTTAAEVAELIAAGQVAVAVRDGRLVGVVRVRDAVAGAGEFGMLAASPEHRGTGVGRALVEFAERRARDRGLRAMRLELFVPREQRNPTKEFLQAWYGRLGYELVATVPVQDAYPDLAPRLATPCDIYCYEKPLSA